MKFFEADIGLDDTEDRTTGSVVFKVLVDDSLRYTSPVMKWDTPTEHVKVPLSGGRMLTLIVEDAGDGDRFDHASWADAVIY
jgi:beta-galactosidase